ncbi:MAG: VWA domain-containing protein [Candidatus Eremiobacterota bacterium]
MEFNYPEAFWLLLLIIPLYYFTRNSISQLPQWRFILSFTLRIIIFILIIASISEVQIRKPNNRLCVIFIADISKSISDLNKEEIKFFINKATGKKPHDDMAGLIVTGGNSSIEFVPSVNPGVDNFSSVVDTNHTNIAGSFQLALAMFPADANKRIVLMSDGQENAGNAINEATIVSANHVPVDILPLDSSLEREVFIKDFTIPEHVSKNEPFDAKIVLESTILSDVKIQFYRNSALTGEKKLSLKPGKNVFFIPQKVEDSGFYTYEIQVITGKNSDTLMDNNRAWAYTKASGEPRILIISEDSAMDRYLVNALKGIEISHISSDNIPTELFQLQNYQTIILNDISSIKFSSEQMKQIQSYVRDLGGGLIMIGGENSFGTGGYYNTPVEETLPVSMDIRKERKMPVMALVLAIDKSGSMADYGSGGVEKIALAREASIACVELLSPSDQIGIIGFDDAAKWVVPFQKRVDDKDFIIKNIASLRAGGGTDAFPALDEARRVLTVTKAMLKHVILLSDGRTAPGDFDSLAKTMAENKITMSCVGIGSDADIPFLQSLAKSGGGRVYFTCDVSLLPRIFTKEALIASKSAIIEENFSPVINSYDEILEGIDTPPVLGGYVVTTAKDRAEVLLLTKEEDPLLAKWYYGLGKSVAFTSDVKGRWSERWIKWKSFPLFWSHVARWAMKSDESSYLETNVSMEENEGKIIVDAIDDEGEFINLLRIKGRIISPSLKSTEVLLKQEGPGRYEGRFPVTEKGTYLISTGNDKVGYQTTGFDVSVPPEYKALGCNRDLLWHIAKETEGRILNINDYDKVFEHSVKQSYQVKVIWPFLIVLAMLLFPLDIAVRRIFLPEGWAEKILVIFTPKKEIAKPFEAETLSRLKSKKSEIIKKTEEKVSILPDMEQVEKKPPLLVQSQKKKDVKITEEVKEISSLSRLKDVKKKALNDFRKD